MDDYFRVDQPGTAPFVDTSASQGTFWRVCDSCMGSALLICRDVAPETAQSNAVKVPGHEALARRKTRTTQESSQHQGSSHTDRHIAEPGRPSEDSRQDSVGV